MSNQTPDTSDNMPSEVRAELDAMKAVIAEQIEAEANVDPHYDRIVETLETVTEKIFEQSAAADKYIFNHEEFVNSLDHIMPDQLAALKNQQLPEDQRQKLPAAEFADRFNRWFVFCDAVVNLGISCLYTQEAAKKEDYETIFKTLKINKQFEVSFLRPRGMRVELTHKSSVVKTKYPWLAMPVLIVTDEKGEEHQIAITPSPSARVWWLDVLISFHGSYDWVLEEDAGLGDEEDVPPTRTDDPRVK